MTISELAEKSDIDASVLSRLLSESEANRRDPRIEHIFAIARALELVPADLVVGTSAEGILGEWTPREVAEAEVAERLKAQNEAAESRLEVARLKSLLAIQDQETARVARELGETSKLLLLEKRARAAAQSFAETAKLELEKATKRAEVSERVASRAKDTATKAMTAAGVVGGLALLSTLSKK